MDYSRLELAIQIARKGLEDGKDEKAKAIALRVIDTAIGEEEAMDIRAVILGMFMALFAMMDAAEMVRKPKDNDPQMRKRKDKKDDNILH